MPVSTSAHPPFVRSLLRSFNRFPHFDEADLRRPPDLARAVPPRRLGRDALHADELDLGASAERASPGLGELLRQAREASGRSIERVGVGLRMRPAHLRAIESGAYEELPAPAYAIGFIRSYADYLGLDGAEMVRRFKRETAGRHTTPEYSIPVPWRERRIAGGGVLLGLVLLGVCGYAAIYSLSSGGADRSDRVAPVPPALLARPGGAAQAPAGAETAASIPAAVIPSLPLRSPAAGLSPSLSQAQPDSGVSRTAAPAPPLEARAASAQAPAPAVSVDPAHVFGVSDGARFRIALRATAETWLEVKDGETSIFHRLMEAGDEYRLPDKAGLVMRVGNARGVEVLVDGRPLPSAAPPSQAHRLVVNLEARELLGRAGTQ